MPTPRKEKPASVILLLYLLCGVGISLGPFRGWAVHQFGRAGLGTFFIVNIMLPIAAIGLGAAHARPRLAAIGGVLLSLGVAIEALIRAQPNPMMWNLSVLAGATHPILVAAALGYALLGAAAAWISNSLRRDVYRPATGSPENSL
ncbi:MAG: hypothetical protein JNK58_06875 [Phycisphaerae bacterium]|nr:hypothetical protein [Phycisphaerae bacterium]